MDETEAKRRGCVVSIVLISTTNALLGIAVFALNASLNLLHNQD